MGNSGTKYNAPCGDGSGFVPGVYPFDVLNRIKIDYINKQSGISCNSNGFSIYIPSKTINTQTNWNDFNICNENDFAQLLNNYAKKYVTIWTDIYRSNNSNNGNNNTMVIQNIKLNEYNEFNVTFSENIKNIDPNWHEKIYAAFVKHPLVCEFENITISTNMHEPSGIEQQLTQLYNGMIRLCGTGRRKNFNPFCETLQMKARKNNQYFTQLVDETSRFEKQIQSTTINMVNLKEGGKIGII